MKWLGCLIVCGLASSGFAERRVALLVGIADPVGAKWAQSSAIEGPPEDVRRMGRLLGDYYSFEVSPLVQGVNQPKRVGRPQFDQAIARATEGLGAGDSFVFYFSGRGAIDAQGDMRLALADANPQVATDREVRLASLASIVDRLEGKGVRCTVVLDASFCSGPPVITADAASLRLEPKHLVRKNQGEKIRSLTPVKGSWLFAMNGAGPTYEVYSGIDQTSGWFTHALERSVELSLGERQVPRCAEIGEAIREMTFRQGRSDLKLPSGWFGDPSRRDEPLFATEGPRFTEAGEARRKKLQARLEGDQRIYVRIRSVGDADDAKAFETADAAGRPSAKRRLADFINRIDPATVQVAGGNDISALDLTLYFNLKKRVYVQMGGDPYTAHRMDPILADGTSGFSLDALDQTEGEWLKATIENIALTQSLYRRFRLGEPTSDKPFRLEPVWEVDAINFSYSAGATVQCLFFERDFAFPLGNLTLPTTDVPATIGSSGNLFEAARGIAGTFVTKYLGVALAPADAVTFPVLPPEGAEGLTKKDLVRNLRQLNESLRKLRTLLDAGQVRWSRATGEFRPRQRAD